MFYKSYNACKKHEPSSYLISVFKTLKCFHNSSHLIGLANTQLSPCIEHLGISCRDSQVIFHEKDHNLQPPLEYFRSLCPCVCIQTQHWESKNFATGSHGRYSLESTGDLGPTVGMGATLTNSVSMSASSSESSPLIRCGVWGPI